MGIRIEPRDQRFATRIDWLDSHHSFSFGHHYDPKRQGFRALRVINDDRIAAGAGFPTHSHRDMEIISYVLEGGLEHKDSLGSGGVIRPGEIQKMSAGTGVAHSEFNASKSEPAHFLQIWIVPERAGLPAAYEQKALPARPEAGGFVRIGGPDAGPGEVTIRQDAHLHLARLSAGQSAEHAIAAGRYGYVFVAKGAVTLGDRDLAAGDGAEITGPETVRIEATEEAEVLLFDLG